MALKNRYEFSQLPFKDFEKIGIQRSQLEKLNQSNRFNLLNSNATGLFKLKVDNKINIGRIFIRPNSKGELKINIIPKRRSAENKLGFSEIKFDKLKKVGFVNGMKKNKEGKRVPYLFQFDRKTNQILAIEKSKINVPKKVSNITLSKEQTEKITSGKTLTLKTLTGKIDFKIDLTKARGFSSMKSKGYLKNKSLDKSTRNNLAR